MGFNLRIATFNCYGIKTSLSTVYELCDKSDIVFYKRRYYSHMNYLSYLLRILNLKVWVSVPLTRLKELLYGGVAILIRKELREYCNFLPYDDPRIMGIEFESITDCIYFMNVYMPYQCTDSDSD